MRDQESCGFKSRAMAQQRAARAEQPRLRQQFDAIAMRRGGDEILHLLREVKAVHENSVDAMRSEEIEPVAEEGASADLDETLRDAIGQRPEPRSEARREQEGFHAASSAVISFAVSGVLPTRATWQADAIDPR